MNKYEILFKTIFDETKNNSINWKQLRRNQNQEFIFNYNLVFRQYESTLTLDGNEFTLLLIEKKYDDPEYDLAY